MTEKKKPAQEKIALTESDLNELKKLVGMARRYLRDRRYLELLDEKLDDATVISPEKLPPDLVEINTFVQITDLDRRERRLLKLVFPRDANYDDRISVIAPLGSALLGSRVGDVVEVFAPARTRRVRVDGIVTPENLAA